DSVEQSIRAGMRRRRQDARADTRSTAPVHAPPWRLSSPALSDSKPLSIRTERSGRYGFDVRWTLNADSTMKPSRRRGNSVSHRVTQKGQPVPVLVNIEMSFFS